MCTYSDENYQLHDQEINMADIKKERKQQQHLNLVLLIYKQDIHSYKEDFV